MFLWLLTFYQTGPNGLFIFYQVFNLILQSAEVFSTNIKAKRLYRSRGFVEETKEKMILH